MSWIAAALALVLSGPAKDPTEIFVGGAMDVRVPPGAWGVALRFGIEDCPAFSVYVFERSRIYVWANYRGSAELIFFGANGPISTVAFNAVEHDVCGICEICRQLGKGHTADVVTPMSQDDYPVSFIVGTYGSIEEAFAAQEIVRRYPRRVYLAARLNPRVIRRVLLEASHALWRAGYLDHRVVVDGVRTVIAGPPLSPEEARRLDALTAAVRGPLEQVLAADAAVPRELRERFPSSCSSGYWGFRREKVP